MHYAGRVTGTIVDRYQLRGVAVTVDGVPLAGASVVLFGQRFRQASLPVRTAADGTFTLPVFEGQSYSVHASYNVPGETFRQLQANEPLTVSGQPEPIRLVLTAR